MTRKRFIKLMMSYDISRNKAVELAAEYNSRNIPYEKAHSRLAFYRIGSAFRNSGKQFKASSAAFKNLSSSMHSAISRATNGIGRC